MHANLNPDHARVILANLPFQPMSLSPEDTGIWVEAKARLTMAAAAEAGAYYRHLIEQGKTPHQASTHVRHRFGIAV